MSVAVTLIVMQTNWSVYIADTGDVSSIFTALLISGIITISKQVHIIKLLRSK